MCVLYILTAFVLGCIAGGLIMSVVSRNRALRIVKAEKGMIDIASKFKEVRGG